MSSAKRARVGDDAAIDARNAEFVRWLRANGVEWDSDALDPLCRLGGADDAPHFGVRALRPLPVGTVVARIAKSGTGIV